MSHFPGDDRETGPEAEWEHAVATQLDSTGLDELQYQLGDVETQLSFAISTGRPEVVGAVVLAVRRAYAERCAWCGIYGNDVESPKYMENEEAAQRVILAAQKLALDERHSRVSARRFNDAPVTAFIGLPL